MQGGVARSWFGIRESSRLDLYKHQEYEQHVGFYRYGCINGKQITSSEYGVDLQVIANAPMRELELPSKYSSIHFWQDKARYGEAPIALLRFFLLRADDAPTISNGSGFIVDEKNNNSAPHTDVFRYWYITKPGTPLLSVVTRKEYLTSVLEFYQRENVALAASYRSLLGQAIRLIAEYEKSGNKAMYASNTADKAKFEGLLAELPALTSEKAQKVQRALTAESADWLAQPATVDLDNYSCFNKTAARCYAFDGFYTGRNFRTVYNWNPDLVQRAATQPAQPLFFRVLFRFKAGEEFSRALLEGFMKRYDFDALRSLL
jgi:hypothetical protein